MSWESGTLKGILIFLAIRGAMGFKSRSEYLLRLIVNQVGREIISKKVVQQAQDGIRYKLKYHEESKSSQG